MPLTITATAKATNANSYATEGEVNTYMEGRLHSGLWDSATPGDRKAALVMACNRLELEDPKGSARTTTQALRWPRQGLYDADGNAVDEDTVPTAVKNAQAELALAYLDGRVDPSASGLEGFERFKLDGVLEVSPRQDPRPGESLPATVVRWMKGFYNGLPGSVTYSSRA